VEAAIFGLIGAAIGAGAGVVGARIVANTQERIARDGRKHDA
jgi:ABC-type antimicrobial peptide transport system permease subunit